MSSLSVERTIRVAASQDNCLLAIESIAPAINKCSLVSLTPSTGTALLEKKMSGNSYGERIAIEVRQNSDTDCDITIMVSPKGLPYLLWRANCDKVMQSVISAFDDAIKPYLSEIAPSNSTNAASPKERIAALKELLDSQLISKEEYEEKRAAIIASI